MCYLLPGLVNVSTGPLYLLDISEQWRRCSYPDLLGNQLKDLTLPDPRETPPMTIPSHGESPPMGSPCPYRGEGCRPWREWGERGKKVCVGWEGVTPLQSHNPPPSALSTHFSRGGKAPPQMGRGVPGEISTCDRANGDAPQESGSSKSIKLIDPDLT